MQTFTFQTKVVSGRDTIRGLPRLPQRKQVSSQALKAVLQRPVTRFGYLNNDFALRVSQQTQLYSGLCKSSRTTTKVQALLGDNYQLPIRIIAQVVTLVVCGAIAWVVNKQTQLEQDANRDAQACPRCNGTGYEPCWCRSWSDGDVGCNTCNHTGYMACRSCGGGGIATPLTVKVNIERR